MLTNGGPFHEKLELALCEYLGVKHISLFTNGTIALVTALQALRISGEVITTPYSFVATAHSLLWNGLKPIFVDIDPFTLSIDPARIESAITPQTTAILPVHCYGRSSSLEEIQRIADIYNLKVIYDAAHAFGVCANGASILNGGDLSVLSFHATKVYNTFEGGAIVSADERTKRRIDHLKNFGFVNETTVVAPGINGKMSEFNAAIGLLQLQKMGYVVRRRKEIYERYINALQHIGGITILPLQGEVEGNYSYFPIMIDDGFPLSRDELYQLMRNENIFTRRYFYPLISEFPMYRGLPSARPENLPVATAVANKVLCLPIYPDLSNQDQDRVISAILRAI